MRWLGLILLSALLITLLELIHLPAALLLGPMVAAIVFAISNRRLSVPSLLFQLSQAVVGAMIARVIPASILSEIGRQWPIFFSCVFSVLIISAMFGWLLARFQVLPGSTAVWGSSPGAATAMVLMAGSFGADVRLVAFMQYLRVMIVALVATLVARFWHHSESAPLVSGFQLVTPIHREAFVLTLLLIAIMTWCGRRWKIPAGPMLLTLLVGSVLQDNHLLQIELPPWLLMLAYAVVGWSIGLRFSRDILKYAAKALPRILLSILCLVVLCGGFAALLVYFAGIDPLTAYLATSPGGADSVAIIAASSQVDMPFVMAMQTGRFIVVLICGPALARLIARLVERKS
ncbi:ammonia monooxygenase [Erwinia sp. OLTSP20]|nr:ammonia monooxygenase [Erwinia sp. OAMSP11]PIJ73992.1 ammonia monooxygenase [Erwinia sp. OLSSP12]PIJ83999.1 ammonia monooxygenase [Erwinia sp. OLCASP19]PIJ86530.1 ammonia monooxygenase [Erwinia sp. OLMTSP26]PIJ88009.1 ammonia monooxygenase [Erwinia sp. OLMDSP33]PIJ90627.1 ammonia monooxygenase [Erwinia sp. OLFS4]PIJ93626.1 ammonia monooxygenase [Erwinia sp. OLTSP20]